MIRVVFSVFVLSVLAIRPAVPQAKCTPTSNIEILKIREGQLRAAGEKLLKTFRDNEAKSFLASVHPLYFRMGEGRNYTVVDLSRAFRKKEEIYCYLFDVSCIP